MSFKSIGNSPKLQENAQDKLFSSPNQCQRKMTLENLLQMIITKGLSQYNPQEINDLKNNIIWMLEEESQPFPCLNSLKDKNEKLDDFSFLSQLCPRLLAEPEVNDALQQIENELSKESRNISTEFIEKQLEILRPTFSTTPTLDFFCHKMQSICRNYSEEKVQILTHVLAKKWKFELLDLLNHKEISLGLKYTQFSSIQKLILEIAKIDAKNSNFLKPFNIKNYGLIDQKSLIEVAIVCAERGEVAESIHKFGITDQQALIKIAMICAKKEEVSDYIRNFGITDQQALTEIAMVCAEKEEMCDSIQNFGIKDPKARIEIAKIDAAKKLRSYPFSIGNYNILDSQASLEIAQILAKNGHIAEVIQDFKITNQDTLIKLAKMSAVSDSLKTCRYIKDFDITDQKALIKIAKICARTGESISEFIKEFDITDEKALIKIAKICVNRSSISSFIQNYGITDQQTLFEIAKIAAVNDPMATALYFQSYGIKDPQKAIEIASLIAVNNGEAISLEIEKFGITDQKALIKIAKAAALKDGWQTSQYIENYNIMDPQALSEIAEIAAAQDGMGTSQHIQNYNIKKKQDLINIAKIAAAQSGKGTSRYIQNYRINDPQALIEIAEISAAQDGGGISQYIENYGIKKQQALIKIAKIAVAQEGLRTSQYIQNYRINNPQALIEIALIATQTHSGPSQYIPNYGIKDQQELLKIAFNSAMQNGIETSIHIQNYNISCPKILFAIFLQAIAQQPNAINHTERYRFPADFCPELIQAFLLLKENPLEISKVITLLEKYAEKRGVSIKEFIEEITKLKKEEGQKITLIWLTHFLGTTMNLTPDQFNLLLKNKFAVSVLSHRNPSFRYSLTKALMDFVKSPQAQNFATTLTSNSRPHTHTTLLLTSILFAQGLPQEVCQQIMNTVSDTYFKDAKNLQNLLNPLLLLLRTPVLSVKDKQYLFKQILKQSNTLSQEGKIDPQKLTQNLLTVSAIFFFKQGHLLNENNLSLLSNNFGQILYRLFTQFIPLKQIDQFESLYTRHFSEARLPHYIATYAAKLHTLRKDKDSVLKTLATCFEQILEGTLKQARYENHPHLNTVFSEKNDLLEKWKQGEICPLDQMVNPISLDFLNTFKTQILIGKHLSFDPQIDVLQKFLKEEMTGKEALLSLHEKKESIQLLKKETTARENPLSVHDKNKTKEFKKEELLALDIQTYCIKLCLEKNPSQCKGILKVLRKKLEVIPDAAEFKKDIEALLELFNQANTCSYNGWTIVDTDEPQDLFLCGTEAGGSCQKIPSDPDSSKCLLAYVIDGKNRLLAIKDPSGRIIARHILRILWNGQQPVLFLERLYPSTIAAELEKALQTFALQRARKLRLPLLSKDVGTGPVYPYSAISLGSPAPFEYCDGVGSVTEGEFKICNPILLNEQDHPKTI